MKGRAFALGLGGNLGDVMGTLGRCVESIEKDPRISSLETASVYETSPWGNVTGGNFLNTAVTGLWTGGDMELLLFCRRLETDAGSTVEKNGLARRLDVDILFLQGGRSSGDMILPHPGISRRLFVLLPLEEIWGGRVPGLNKTVSELLQSVDDESSIIFRGSLKAD